MFGAIDGTVLTAGAAETHLQVRELAFDEALYMGIHEGVDAVEAADEQGGAQHGRDDDQAAHRGGAFLLHLAFETEVADVFADLFLAEQLDHLAAGEVGDQHTEHGGEHGAEGQEVEQSGTGDVDPQLLEPVKKVIQHDSRVLKVSSTISRSSKWLLTVPRIW